MYCENCGTKNDDNARFCCECGSPLMEAPQEEEKKPEVKPEIKSSVDVKTKKTSITPKNNKISKKALAGIGAGVVVLLVAGGIVNNNRKTIDLNKFLVVETQGYDGYGTAKVNINWDAIEKKYKSRLSFKNLRTAKSLKDVYGDSISPIEFLEDRVSVETEDSEYYVSNGDKVAYTWTVSKDIASDLNCKIKYKDGEEKISGLEKTKKTDVFKNVSVSFEGTSPNGTATVTYNGGEIGMDCFSYEPSEGLRNGDKVTVKINDNGVNSLAQGFGEVPEKTEKEYTVSGLASSLEKIDQIDKDSLKAMQQQASDVYNAYMAQNWEGSSTLESFTYLGDYLLTSKSGSSSDDDYYTDSTSNILYLVYKTQIRSQYSDEYSSYDSTDDIYWYISYSNLMLNGDGTVKFDVLSYNTPDSGVSINNGSWYYTGYDSLDALYKNVVTARLDYYNHEDNVDANAKDTSKASKDKKKKDDSAKEDSAATSEQAAGDSSEAATDNAGEDTADAAAANAATGDASEFVLPNSSTEPISITDVEGLTQYQCLIARNEIYARHGRKFKDQGLQEYFNNCSWYNGTIEPDDFQESYLSDLERENEEIIVGYEEEMGYR